MKKNLILLLVLVTGLLYGQAPMQVLNEIDGTTMVCVTNLLPSLQVLENSVPFLTAHINDAAIHLTPEQAQRIEQSATTQELEQVTGDLHSHTSNAAIHLTPEQATKIAQSATTQELEQALSEIDFTEKDPAFWREYYYGDPNIYPSPTNWFTFAPVSGGWSCTGFSEEYNNTPDIVIPYEFMGQEVVRIGSGAFEGKNIKSVIGSKAIVAIGDAAFYECVSLASISLPQATHIGSTAFTLCVSLASISLPQATSIGSAAFSGCYLSTSISLPQATSIGSVAFSDCESLTNITFGSVAPTFAGSYHFYNTPETLTITITDPTATGYGDWIGDPPRRVVRPALHTDVLSLKGTNYTSITTVDVFKGHTNDTSLHLTPEQVTRISQAVSTNELQDILKDIVGISTNISPVMNTYHYGDSNLYPHPTSWFNYGISLEGDLHIVGLSTAYSPTPSPLPELVVPYEINGMPVRGIGLGIGSPAFFLYPTPRIRLPRSITYIHYNCLWDSAVKALVTWGNQPEMSGGGGYFKEVDSELKVIVENPSSTGWGDTFGGVPVIRLALNVDELHAKEMLQNGHKVVDTNMLEDTISNLPPPDLSSVTNPYQPWTAAITSVSGTVTITADMGLYPVITLGGETTIIIDDEGYTNQGVSAFTLSLWKGGHQLELNESNVIYAEPMTLLDDDWSLIYYTKVGDSKWRAVAW